MSQLEKRPRVWLIDRRNHWREEAEKALARACYRVCTWSDYDSFPRVLNAHGCRRSPPGLAVLGCTRVGKAERHLIEAVLALPHPFVVISSMIELRTSLELFRGGARDVVRMSPEPSRIVELVMETFRRSEPLSHYEAVARRVG